MFPISLNLNFCVLWVSCIMLHYIYIQFAGIKSSKI